MRVHRRLLPLLLLCGAMGSGCFWSSSSDLDEEKETHFLAGKSRVNEMDYIGAIVAFEKALEVNPQSAAAHFELGWLNEEKQGEPATAIYHYSRYLQLRPQAENGETVKARILACKQQLARAVSLGPVTQSLQQEFERLNQENKKLREDVEKWKTYALALQAQTNGGSTSSAPQRNPGPGSTAGAATTNTGRTSTPLAGTRSHTVQPGETPSSIAKKYNIKVESLLAANRGLEPKRMRPNQVLTIPPGP